MRVTKTEQRAVEVLDDVTCDRCGESLCAHSRETRNVNGVTVRGSGAWDSTHFPDMVQIDVDVCERCAAEWFASFKRNPLTVQEGER